MAIKSLFIQLLESFTKQFIKDVGRRPQTTKEIMSIQDEVVRYINLTKGKGITGSVRTSAGDVKPIADPFQGFKPTVIQGGKSKEGIGTLLKDSPEAIAKMKADNKAAIKRLQEKKKTVEDFSDDGDFDPGGMASGGLARVGMFVGGSVWKKFIEKLFIKSSNDIRQGKGLFKGLNQEQMITQHDNLTKMLKKWEMSGKKGLPEGASQYLGVNDLQVSKAIKDATKKVKKVDKDRLATADELEDAREIVDPTGEAYMVEEGMTVKELDKMVADHKAYMADMQSQYMRGDLEKYVKPEILEESRVLRQKKIDKVLDKAYDEIAGGSGFSDDYKMAADELSSSIAEQLGKGEFSDLSQMYQTDIYNTALKRVTGDLKKKLSQPTKTLEGIKKEGTIDISDPEVADEFTTFVKESDPKGYRDLEQKIQLEDFDVTGRKKNASGGIAGQLHMNEGGRVPMIFGGSTGLKAMIASIKAGLNKGRPEKIKTLFPKYSAADKEILRLGEKYLPKDSATLAAKEIEAKAEGIQVLIDRLKHDKKLIAEQAKSKAKNDPSLDFLMESLEKTMPEAYGPHLKKYTNIDKDILQLETIKKNLIMKDRKLNAEGGRVSLSNGGLANILGV